MEKSKKDKSIRGEKSRKRVKMTRDVGKKKREEQVEGNEREKVFWMWRVWVYCLTLQKWREREICTDVLK